MKRRIGPVEHLYGQAARQAGHHVCRIMRETVRANRSAQCVQGSCGLEPAYRPTHVLHVYDDLAKSAARKQVVEFARTGGFLSSRDGIERVVPDEMYLVMSFRIRDPHERIAARIEKLVGDRRRPFRAGFERDGSRL